MLKIKNLCKSYKKAPVIENLSLDIPEGDFVSIIGPSGVGKSTLLLMLGGMLTPTSGSITFLEKPLSSLCTEERALLRMEHMGFVFQTFNLIPYLTAMENVQIPLLLAGLTEEEQRERASKVLTRVGLEKRLDHKPNELSIGQQQRVALARTIVNDPALILADEPTGNLDPKMRNDVLSFFKELNEEGKTIVMVTHDNDLSKQTKTVFEMGS
jgi:putative ABC transport system ATP-binding protein